MNLVYKMFKARLPRLPDRAISNQSSSRRNFLSSLNILYDLELQFSFSIFNHHMLLPFIYPGQHDLQPIWIPCKGGRSRGARLRGPAAFQTSCPDQNINSSVPWRRHTNRLVSGIPQGSSQVFQSFFLPCLAHWCLLSLLLLRATCYLLVSTI